MFVSICHFSFGDFQLTSLLISRKNKTRRRWTRQLCTMSLIISSSILPRQTGASRYHALGSLQPFFFCLLSHILICSTDCFSPVLADSPTLPNHRARVSCHSCPNTINGTDYANALTYEEDASVSPQIGPESQSKARDGEFNCLLRLAILSPQTFCSASSQSLGFLHEVGT